MFRARLKSLLKAMLKDNNELYLVILATVIITRLGIILLPEIDVKVGGMIIHHFWFGLIFFLIGLLIAVRLRRTKLLFLGVGFGLFLDELIFMILGGGNDREYWAILSSLGTITLLILLFFFKDRMFTWELKHGLNFKKYFTNK